MSTDLVDDLHAAEDLAGRFAAETRDLLLWIDLCIDLLADAKGWRPGALPSSVSNLLIAIAEWDTYCRPTCNPNDEDDHDEVCEQGEDCGCPCRARAEREDYEPPERELPGDEP